MSGATNNRIVVLLLQLVSNIDSEQTLWWDIRLKIPNHLPINLSETIGLFADLLRKFDSRGMIWDILVLSGADQYDTPKPLEAFCTCKAIKISFLALQTMIPKVLCCPRSIPIACSDNR